MMPSTNPATTNAPRRTDEQAEQLFHCVQSLTKCCQRQNLAFIGSAALNPAETDALNCFEDKDWISPEDVAARLRVTRGRVTHILDALERKRLIQRGVRPEDRRAVRVTLTRFGRETMGRAARGRLEAARAVLSRIPETRRMAVFESLRLLEAALHEVDTQPDRGE